MAELEDTRQDSDGAAAVTVAALEHLTGPSRGATSWLSEAAVDVVLTPGRVLRVIGAKPGEPQENLVARLHRSGDSYEIEAPEGRAIWVNGARIEARRLTHCDMIEFGELGPLSRFRLHGESRRMRQSMSEIVCNCIDYMRASRQPMRRRIVLAMRELLRELTFESTVLFRVSVIVALGVLAALAYQQYRFNRALEQGMQAGAMRIEDVATAVARARDEALHPGDLAELSQEIGARVSSNLERLEALEQRSQAGREVIAQALPAVALLQGSYSFRDRGSGRMLRHVTGAAGVPVISPRGQPLLTLEGDGPVVELQVIGTGFFAGATGVLVTNRHVAMPWEQDAGAALLASGELEPVIPRFIGYAPGRTEAFAVELLAVSETADLAVLRAELTEPVVGLTLADAPPAAGDEIIVMGYPTGLRSLLAQSGVAFVEALQESEDTGFWEVAARLAEAGFIAPLASRGIVGHATAETVVYDAETTHGGSGGPVLDMRGKVVGVNTAILPEFGGSNLGVPAAKVQALLDQAGM